jgi:beta-lactamase superfamily II metal-dependent hydrolase
MTGGYEIDMFDVALGDHIVVTLTEPSGEKISVIIDGGTKKAAEETLDRLKEYHGSNTCVVISTHPDNDHIGGLPTVIDEMKPVEVYVNNPLNFIDKVSLYRNAASLQEAERDRLKSAVERIEEVTASATKCGATIKTAYQGDCYDWKGWKINFLNPEQVLYENIWGTSDGLKELYADKTVKDSETLRNEGSPVLDDGTDTTYMNNSSVMTLIEGYGQKLLFTGDAGMMAIRSAAQTKDISNIDFLDCPHHGSRRNVDTEILGYLKPSVVFISSPKKDESLPCDEVIATIQSNGGFVCTTKHHNSICYSWNITAYRPGYGAIEPLPLLLLPGTGQ